jgi:hypothetical protein
LEEVERALEQSRQTTAQLEESVLQLRQMLRDQETSYLPRQPNPR